MLKTINYKYDNDDVEGLMVPSLIVGVNDLQSVNPTLASEWNYDKNAPLKPNMVAIGSHKKVWWKCQQGHEWISTTHNRNSGNGCPYCSGRLAIVGETDLKTLCPEIASEWNYSKNGNLIPENVTRGSSKKVWWICCNGHEWESTIAHRTNGRGCPVCNGENSTSFPEQALYFYVKQLFPNAINHYKPKWLKDGSSLLEIDVFIPDLNTGIEYDGQVFHRNLARDLNKDRLIQSNNVHLLRIREPKCPKLDSTSVCFEIHDIRSQFYYENAIIEVLHYLINIANLSIDIDVDIKRDYSNIQNSYEHTKKEKSVLSADPGLLAEWDYEKNAKITPQKISYGSSKMVWWKCKKCSYEWLDSPKHRHAGRGCPNCANISRISTRIKNSIINGNSLYDWCNQNESWGMLLLSEWDDKNGFSPSEITCGSSKKVWWKCINGHQWQASINNRMRGASCPYCSNKKTLSGYNDLETLYPELMHEWIYERNTIDPSTIRPGSNKKAWWRCEKCGYEWEAMVYNRTGNKSGCPLCAGQKIVIGKNDLATLFPELLCEWDYERNTIQPNEVSSGTDKKAWWICKECGNKWNSSIGDRTRGHGCPRCARSKAGKSKKRTQKIDANK